MTVSSNRRTPHKPVDALPDATASVHYLHRSPSPIMAIIVTLAALAILSLGIYELQSQQSRQMAVGINAVAHGEKANVPELQVNQTSLAINNQPVASGDAVFRLSGLAATQRGIIVSYPPELPADRLANALDLVNQAGFSQVSLQSLAQKNTVTTVSSTAPSP